MFELKESDLPELERLAKSGYEWIAKDWNEQVYAYTAKPFKNTTTWVGGLGCEKIIGLGINSQIGVHWSDPEPLNIADAIAQIKAGMKACSATGIPATMKVPKHIRAKMESALKHFQAAHKLMNDIDQYLDGHGVYLLSVRCGDGGSLEEIEYGMDVIDEICARLESGEFEEDETHE